MRISQLKVKVKSLAAEQRIIRREEQRARKSCRWQSANGSPPEAVPFYTTAQRLQSHRKEVVRPEARSACIAYALLKGRTLEQIETPRNQKSLVAKPYRAPDWDRVDSILNRFGDGSISTEQYRKQA